MTSLLPVTSMDVVQAVGPETQARLLGLPCDRVLDGLLAERATMARSWYATHGRPFVAWRRDAVERVDATGVTLASGTRLRSATLARRLTAASAHAFVALAASAGPEVGDEADRHWREGRPDEAYFLDRFGAAVAERLVGWAGAALARQAAPAEEHVLPHLSPGCGGWDLADQPRLFGLVFGDDSASSGPLLLLDSGGLFPRHSVLAGLGVAPLTEVR